MKYEVEITEEADKLFDLVVADINTKVKEEDRTDKQGWIERVIRDWLKSRIFGIRMQDYQTNLKKELDEANLIVKKQSVESSTTEKQENTKNE